MNIPGDRGGGVLRRLAVMISGRGSNMVSILDAIDSGQIPAEAVLVLSDRSHAPGLARAAGRGVPTLALDFRDDPEVYHQQLQEALTSRGVDLIALAGYMRILPPWFVQAWRGRMLNIHPSLLPAFPGLGAPRQAIEHGVKVSGCTVHFVDEGVDSGPIVCQAAVQVKDDDTPQSLAARILEVEHRVYPDALSLVASGTVCVEGRRVVRRPGVLTDRKA